MTAILDCAENVAMKLASSPAPNSKEDSERDNAKLFPSTLLSKLIVSETEPVFVTTQLTSTGSFCSG